MHKQLLKTSLLGLGIASLAGCAPHLTRSQCQNMNWQQVGVSDGSVGKAPRSLTQDIKDCQKFHLSVNTAAYHTGYEQGVAQYCKPNYALGLQNGQAGAANAVKARTSFCEYNGKTIAGADYNKGYQKGLQSYCTYQQGNTTAVAGKAENPACMTSQFGKYQSGWAAGNKQLCSNAQTGFIYGQTGKAYPAGCAVVTYPQFKQAYDRGRAVKVRLDQLNSQVSQINNNISDIVDDDNLYKESDGSYSLGNNHSEKARKGLYEVNRLLKKRDALHKEIFKLKLDYSSKLK